MKKYALLDAILEAVSGLVMMAFFGLCIIVLLTSCTVATSRYGDFSLTVVSLQPSGRTTEVKASLDGVGELSIGSSTEDSSSVVGAVVDAAVGL